MSVKFFSAEWGEQARDMWNTSPRVQDGLADPGSFSYVMEMGVIDRDGVTTNLELECGKCAYWGLARHAADECDFQIWATLANWKRVCTGEVNPIMALSTKEIEFRKGPVSEAIRNATAFEGVMLGMGDIDTDWAL
ncbi:MAG: SCP2 sterol-binding domain-containing protein [Actinobacteria bacterium]|nr:SCP2 sterol-binding domain-containing protein [Actinomycetota bacterium]